jgi:predicted alpha/beta superfamily hydrolase
VDRKGAGGSGDDYCRFIVDSVKPCIDTTFRTLPDREHTAIMGSSMGGLISLFAFFHYGHIFGGAGVLSPSLWFAQRAIFGYVQMAPFQPGKIYLDTGTAEGWPALSDARLMAKLLERKGYRRGKDLSYVEMQGDRHCEAAWADRLELPLRYLMGYTGEKSGTVLHAH